jgi:hypothetical protein
LERTESNSNGTGWVRFQDSESHFVPTFLSGEDIPTSFDAPINSKQAYTSPPQDAITGHHPCPYPGCARTFNRTFNLFRHNVLAHGQPRVRYLCPLAGCRHSLGEGFSRHDKLREHMRKVHGNHKFEEVVHPSDELAEVVHPSDELAEVVHPSNESAEVVYPSDKSAEVVHPSDELAEVVHPSDELAEVVHPSNESAEVVYPSDKSAEVVHPSDELAEVVHPSDESREVVHPTSHLKESTLMPQGIPHPIQTPKDSFIQSISLIFTAAARFCRVKSRPRVAEGYRRLEWKCVSSNSFLIRITSSAGKLTLIRFVP